MPVTWRMLPTPHQALQRVQALKTRSMPAGLPLMERIGHLNTLIDLSRHLQVSGHCCCCCLPAALSILPRVLLLI